VGRLEEFAAKIAAGLEDSDWLSKREMIRALVKRVEVTPDRVNVVFRVDPYPGEANPEKKSLQLYGRSSRTTTGCSAPVPRVGTLPLVGPPLAGFPWHRGDRFPRSPHKPGSRSRHLYAGRRSGRKQVAPELLLE